MKGKPMSNQRAQEYWKANIRILLSLLSVWFIVSFGAGILFVDALDAIRFGGFKLGFWMAQQGSIFVFVVLVYAYIHLMDRLDKRFNLDSDADAKSNQENNEEKSA